MNLNYDKNAKIISLPDGIQEIPSEFFMNFENLEVITIPESVHIIGTAAFKGCKSLKKVILPKSLQILDEYAFSECSSLEEITIPESLTYIAKGLFSHCHNLKKINLHKNVNYIDDYAFYDCHNLKDFEIPLSTTSIGYLAFKGCSNIKEIHIPKNISSIEEGAFAYMTSLEKITVDKENQRFFSDEEKTLISNDGAIIQYALNCDEEEFIVGYCIKTIGLDEEGNPIKSNELIYSISNYAFAGAKKLKKIYLASEVDSIGSHAFENCDNLKDLEVFHSSYGDAFLCRVYPVNEEANIPFENITIEDGIKVLCSDLAEFFKNAKTISLPNDLEHISHNVFSKSTKLKEIKIPSSIKIINPNTFSPNIELCFFNSITLKAPAFNMFQTKTTPEYYIQHNERDNIRILSLTNGTYLVKINDFPAIKITQDEICHLSKTSHKLRENPSDIILYLINLLYYNQESDNVLLNVLSNSKLKDTFIKFAEDLSGITEIAQQKVSTTIREILEEKGIQDDFLFSSLLIKNLTQEEIRTILNNYSIYINRFFRITSKAKDNVRINVDKLITYCKLLEKYKRYDPFLYNTIFIDHLNPQNQEFLIKYYNKNLKRLLILSNTIKDSFAPPLNDLINLCNALGVFTNNSILSQKIMTFISEVMFNPNSQTFITPDQIHSIFGDIKPREEIDLEFTQFFINNYEKLISIEEKNSGIISRIYNTFREISKTSTSHRGSQRHLKVTIEKCLDFFLANKFENITEENKELAFLLQKYYSEPYVLPIAEQLIKQSRKAPRNIFTCTSVDENGNTTYDNNPDLDLKEPLNSDFSYEWLPKQSYDNLILGKYCSCCAHILGAGAGIMHASMILDNCQNLVIRNEEGLIIAKMTIYVNKEKGYAVFNTAEINTSYDNNFFYYKIYQAFLRGVHAFIKKYNENNKIPLNIITIGEYRNNLKEQLGNTITTVLPTPNYSDYGYYINEKRVGDYDGDSKQKQILVYKIK